MTLMENTQVEAPDPPPMAPKGLKGVVVARTGIGEVRGEQGFYHYRQYPAVELARSRPLEDVWRLLLDGALPADVPERRAFSREVRAARDLPVELWRVLPAIAAACQPLDGLRTALSMLGPLLGFGASIDRDAAQLRRDAIALAAATPTLVAALHRLGLGEQPIPPREDLDHAANLLWMLDGSEPGPRRARAIEQYLVTTIDHGFNASTFTARVVASTGADLGATVVAALGALGGPLHGGAPSRVLDLLAEIGSAARTGEVVRARLDAGERIMGFGHAVYRTEDPRSVLLREVALGLGGPLVELAVEVERRVVQLLGELRPGQQLRTNVEYYAAVVMATCGLSPAVFTPTFAASRTIGWTAHVLEQVAEPGIIRPSAHYDGPPPPQPVPDLA